MRTQYFVRAFSAEKKSKVFRAKIANEAVVGADDSLGEVAFCALKLEHLFFDRIPRDEPVDENRSRLADALRLSLSIRCETSHQVRCVYYAIPGFPEWTS